jgi:hypothetical protein
MQNGGGNAGLRRAQRWLAGESSPKGIEQKVLGMLEHHRDEFGPDYSSTFVAAVPEPGTANVVLLILSHCAARVRFRGLPRCKTAA